MTPPKKRMIPFWDGKNGQIIEKHEYISVNHLQEWIDSMVKTEIDLGWMSLLVKLETFIHDKK